MNSQLEATWSRRELPILVESLRRLDIGELQPPPLEEIRQAVGLTVAEMRAAIEALETADPPYIDVGLRGMAGADHVSGSLVRVSERTRRELGTWPSAEDVVERLVEALREAATEEPEPQKKNRLVAAADVLAGMARDVAVSVVAARIGTL